MNTAQTLLPYFYPLSLTLGLLLLSLGALIFRRIRLAATFIVLAYSVIFISAKCSVSHLYLFSLEGKYPAVNNRAVIDEWSDRCKTPIEYIVVLGAGGVFNAAHPLTSQIPMPGVVRVAEAVRWWREYPTAKILLSGGAALGGSTEAEMMKGLCIQLGVPDVSIEVDVTSKSSEEQINVLSRRMGQKGFLLITSAHKMKRIGDGFKESGSHFIAIPTDYTNKLGISDVNWISDHPWAEGLGRTEQAIKEGLGLLWRSYNSMTQKQTSN